jgi:negative regulator of sigma E activity
MSEETSEFRQRALEERSRALFQASVEGLDMRTRSRLTQARHAALEAADRSAHRSWLLRMPVWTSAAGVTAAAVLGVALWFGGPLGHHGAMPAEAQSNFEDLDMVASTDEGSGDPMEMLQDDIDFYDWADKAASAEPSA